MEMHPRAGDIPVDRLRGESYTGEPNGVSFETAG